MRRFTPPAWVLSAFVVAIAFAGLAFADSQALHWYMPASRNPTVSPAASPVPTPESDIVVNVIVRCTVISRSYTDAGGVRETTRDGNGAECRQNSPNLRAVVTVRTAQGSGYEAEKPLSRTASIESQLPTVGSPWPP